MIELLLFGTLQWPPSEILRSKLAQLSSLSSPSVLCENYSGGLQLFDCFAAMVNPPACRKAKPPFCCSIERTMEITTSSKIYNSSSLIRIYIKFM